MIALWEVLCRNDDEVEVVLLLLLKLEVVAACCGPDSLYLVLIDEDDA